MSDNEKKELDGNVGDIDNTEVPESAVEEDSGLGEAEEIVNWAEEESSAEPKETTESEPEEEDVEDDGDEEQPDKTRAKKEQQKREKKKRVGSQKKEKPEVKEPNAVAEYVRGIRHEMKLTTWPNKHEVLVWSLIVMAVIAFFALLTFVIDNFIATPLMYMISGVAPEGTVFGAGSIALVVLFFASGLGTAAGVMLHSGGESNGLSDTLSTQLTGGSAVAEKNLDRITIVLALVFAAVLIAMMIAFPQGTITGMA